MLKDRGITLPNFTVEEREDFLQILKVLRIDADVMVTFVIQVDKADYDAMFYVLKEFERGRKKKR